MKYKVLCWQYDDKSNFCIVGLYPESKFEQADSDYQLLERFGDDDENYYLIEMVNKY